MSRRIRPAFTEAEARELLIVAYCGYGDGDFYQLNNEGYPPNAEERRNSDIFMRALNKLNAARDGVKS